MSDTTTTQQEQDQGSTKNDQKQEPELSRDATVIAAGNAKLAALGDWTLREMRDGMGDLDGGTFQEHATNLGVLVMEDRAEACGEGCECAEFGFPTECYRFAPDVRAAMAARVDGAEVSDV